MCEDNKWDDEQNKNKTKKTALYDYEAIIAPLEQLSHFGDKLLEV